jgi:DNA replication protein DnaD
MIDLICESCRESKFAGNIEFKLLQHILDKNLVKNKVNSITAFR